MRGRRGTRVDRGRHRRNRRTLWAGAGLLLMGAVAVPVAAALGGGGTAPPGAVPTTAVARPSTTTGPPATVAAGPDVPSVAPTPTPTPTVGEPRRLAIERIGVDAAVEGVGTLADGTLSPPTDPAQTGWYTQSSAPGELGPAVLVGHLDSRTGPGVFVRLGELRPGDDMSVTDAAGVVRHFTVTSVERYAKAQFPSDLVYGASPDAELRLVTCGGAYVKGAGGYVDNLIVQAVAG